MKRGGKAFPQAGSDRKCEPLHIDEPKILAFENKTRYNPNGPFFDPIVND